MIDSNIISEQYYYEPMNSYGHDYVTSSLNLKESSSQNASWPKNICAVDDTESLISFFIETPCNGGK